MTGDPKEAVEKALLAVLQAITRTAGYDLPADFVEITRELKMYDQVRGYPSLILQAEDTDPQPQMSFIVEKRVPVRVICYFRTSPGSTPASDANRYCGAIGRAIMQDVSLGGLIDLIQPAGTPPALLYRDEGDRTVLESTSRFEALYEYDPRLNPVTN